MSRKLLYWFQIGFGLIFGATVILTFNYLDRANSDLGLVQSKNLHQIYVGSIAIGLVLSFLVWSMLKTLLRSNHRRIWIWLTTVFFLLAVVGPFLAGNGNPDSFGWISVLPYFLVGGSFTGMVITSRGIDGLDKARIATEMGIGK